MHSGGGDGGGSGDRITGDLEQNGSREIAKNVRPAGGGGEIVWEKLNTGQVIPAAHDDANDGGGKIIFYSSRNGNRERTMDTEREEKN